MRTETSTQTPPPAAEAALDPAEQALSAVIGAAPISLLLLDRDLRVIAASRRSKSDFGLSDGDLTGLSFRDLAPETTEQMVGAIHHCLDGASVSLQQVAMPRIDGQASWAQIEIMSWSRSSGEVGGLIIGTHDITAMVRALERAERSEQRLTLAMEIADIHVWELDHAERKLIKAGAEATFFSEPKTYEELDADIFSIVDPRDRPPIEAAALHHPANGEPFTHEYRIARSDGREVWTVCAARLIRDPKGQPLRAVAAMQNITARKAQERALLQAKEQAEAANLAKSAFLATISHEIRTPLNGVLGMVQAMAADTLAPQQRERLEVIGQSGASLLALLNDILDLSKIEAGKLALEQAPFELDALVRGAHTTFGALAIHKKLDFDLKIERGAGGVYLGDAVRVRQILSNLLSNALKFTDEGGVDVRVDRRDGAVRIVVRDTGIGLSAEQLTRVFHNFEQADASTTRRYGGSGLGLAICRDLVQMMDGSISAHSTPGAGATFTVILPLLKTRARRRPKPLAEAGPAPTAASPLKVLAAEDNAMNQLVLKTLLAQIGIEPTIVVNGCEAVAAWEREHWDLILMDVQMPLMDGPTAAALIRAEERARGSARTPIVALTANAMNHQVDECLASGMDDFVAKPIDARKLFAMVMTATARGRAGPATVRAAGGA
jgi:PAS domain S-box-containing protein